jgi:hypothetical protein
MASESALDTMPPLGKVLSLGFGAAPIVKRSGSATSLKSSEDGAMVVEELHGAKHIYLHTASPHHVFSIEITSRAVVSDI